LDIKEVKVILKNGDRVYITFHVDIYNFNKKQKAILAARDILVDKLEKLVNSMESNSIGLWRHMSRKMKKI